MLSHIIKCDCIIKIERGVNTDFNVQQTKDDWTPHLVLVEVESRLRPESWGIVTKMLKFARNHWVVALTSDLGPENSDLRLHRCLLSQTLRIFDAE